MSQKTGEVIHFSKLYTDNVTDIICRRNFVFSFIGTLKLHFQNKIKWDESELIRTSEDDNTLSQEFASVSVRTFQT